MCKVQGELISWQNLYKKLEKYLSHKVVKYTNKLGIRCGKYAKLVMLKNN